MRTAAVKVECTNCGGLGLGFWLTLAALAIAACALAIAFREHRQFLRQLRARARFKLRLRTLRAGDDGVLHTEGSRVGVIVEIGLKNEGDRAAGPTLINVIAPRSLETFRFCGPNGEELPDAQPPIETPEILQDGAGNPLPSKFLYVELPRVRLRPHYVRFVKLEMEVPDHGEADVPLRVTAQADELPDDTEEVSQRLSVRAVRSNPAPELPS